MVLISRSHNLRVVAVFGAELNLAPRISQVLLLDESEYRHSGAGGLPGPNGHCADGQRSVLKSTHFYLPPLFSTIATCGSRAATTDLDQMSLRLARVAYRSLIYVTKVPKLIISVLGTAIALVLNPTHEQVKG